MTDEELDRIELDAWVHGLPTPEKDVLALVAEVRRLRVELRHAKFRAAIQ